MSAKKLCKRPIERAQIHWTPELEKLLWIYEHFQEFYEHVIDPNERLIIDNWLTTGNSGPFGPILAKYTGAAWLGMA